MGKIYAHNHLYSSLVWWVKASTRRSYRRLEVLGEENIPKSGAVLFAPNHSNALMDALLILMDNPGHVVFGARADMFKKPLIAKTLHFLRILPMVRERDGLRNVIKNYEAMDTITEVLAHNVPFCMFCEGTHRTMHSLLPLKKGILRTAIYAGANLSQDVWIVPTGLEYRDYFRYRSTATIEYGEPINVSEYIRSHQETPQAEQYRYLSELLRSRMADLITYVDDDESYEGTWALTRVLTAGEKTLSLKELKELNKMTLEQIRQLSASDPIKAEGLKEDALALDAVRKVRRISMRSFGSPHPGWRALGRSLLTLLTLPIWLASAVVSLPVWLIGEILSSRLEDKAFCNSFRCGQRIFTEPLTTIIWAVIGFIFLPWYCALILLVFNYFSCNIFYDWLEFTRVTISDIRLFFQKDLRQSFDSIRRMF